MKKKEKRSEKDKNIKLMIVTTNELKKWIFYAI